MKKLIAMLLALVLVLGLVACGQNGAEETVATTQPTEATENNEVEETTVATEEEAPAGTLEAEIAAILEKHAAMELPLMTMAMDLTDLDALGYNAGLSSADKISEAAICEPMMGQPFSLVVVRVKDAADAEAVAKEMKENIDNRKWVCMEADTEVAAYCNDLAIFFMVSSEFSSQATTATMLDAIKAVYGDAVTEVA